MSFIQQYNRQNGKPTITIQSYDRADCKHRDLHQEN